jgi:hypothetical protein
MLISECNSRISELRAMSYPIQTREHHRDQFGFVYHGLKPTVRTKAPPRHQLSIAVYNREPRIA